MQFRQAARCDAMHLNELQVKAMGLKGAQLREARNEVDALMAG